MNEHYLAMRELAALRDGMVVQLFVAAFIVLASAGLMRVASLPASLRDWLIRAQLAAGLLAWVGLIVVLGSHQ